MPTRSELIHRDLKPGNIWLTADGTAKLGDFGLAVALDQTRHTQPGMMVGTMAYMAPEQAIGGAVDARSDLYALGCVLYELVCGRPPFVGEESVAIITPASQYPARRTLLAPARVPAGPGSADPALAGEGSRTSGPPRPARCSRR